MKLFELITKEFIYIVDTLLVNEAVEDNRIIIDKEYFKRLLEKYKYMSFKEKTGIYKDLNFLIHDKNNYTLPCRDRENRKSVRKVVINYKTYVTLKSLISQEVAGNGEKGRQNGRNNNL